MTQITLNIPDDELGFFMKLIEKFNYESLINDFSMNQEMKDLLDERRSNSNKEDFVSWTDVKEQIVFKSK
ncbi:MAG: hypothetical protein ACOYLT_11020 [Flavobacterium sp.]|jgi:hypothetical protein|uniref:hypothetical protein n=1 Tax=Flavobacterium sp. TaxID=239 RepID=UPI003BD5142D